jgi:preprotein translocase subunit YajC
MIEEARDSLHLIHRIIIPSHHITCFCFTIVQRQRKEMERRQQQQQLRRMNNRHHSGSS